jgi:hypothetical protein
LVCEYIICLIKCRYRYEPLLLVDSLNGVRF